VGLRRSRRGDCRGNGKRARWCLWMGKKMGGFNSWMRTSFISRRVDIEYGNLWAPFINSAPPLNSKFSTLARVSSILTTHPKTQPKFEEHPYKIHKVLHDKLKRVTLDALAPVSSFDRNTPRTGAYPRCTKYTASHTERRT
jgi:hypothetical protein